MAGWGAGMLLTCKAGLQILQRTFLSLRHLSGWSRACLCLFVRTEVHPYVCQCLVQYLQYEVFKKNIERFCFVLKASTILVPHIFILFAYLFIFSFHSIFPPSKCCSIYRGTARAKYQEPAVANAHFPASVVIHGPKQDRVPFPKTKKNSKISGSRRG